MEKKGKFSDYSVAYYNGSKSVQKMWQISVWLIVQFKL